MTSDGHDKTTLPDQDLCVVLQAPQAAALRAVEAPALGHVHTHHVLPEVQRQIGGSKDACICEKMNAIGYRVDKGQLHSNRKQGTYSTRAESRVSVRGAVRQ